MSKFEFLQPRFSEGVLAKSLQGRSSEEFYHYGFKASKNMIPVVSGPLVKRPGTNFIGEAKNSTSMFVPFFKDQDNTYILELSYDSGMSLRVWSQDQQLKVHGTTNIYEVTSGMPWTSADELSTIKTTQSGDIIFICCPTKKPHKISRTLVSSGTRANDDSVWVCEEFVMEDGPYNAINYYHESDSTKRISLKLSPEPTHKEEVAEVAFNTVDDSCVLANHGLQTGMHIRLDDDGANTDTYEDAHSSSGNHGWGNITTDGNENGTTVLTDSNYWCVSSKATAFQFSSSDGGTPLEFELRKSDGTPASKSNTKVKLYRYCYVAGTTVTFKVYNNKSTSTANRDIAKGYFKSTDVGRLIRINPLTKPGENIGGIRWAWGIIASVTNGTLGQATDAEITVTLKTELSNTRETYGTAEFRLGAFSDGQGWPQVSQIFQQRMVLAANTMQPSTIWLSKTGNFYSFSPTEIQDQDMGSVIVDGVATETITDSNSLTFTLDSDTLDVIKWLGESKKLAMGTSAGVYMLYGSETNLVVTPTRFTINRETSFSATDVAPIVVSNALMYTQIGGKDVQELSLGSGAGGQWFASKISLKGYDIIKTSEMKKMIWQERPNGIIWILMADGRLLSLSYDRKLEFQAWAEHVIGGVDAKVLDIEMIPKASHDQVWLKVSRTIDGGTKYYMETLGRFPSEGALARNAYVFSDSAVTKSIGGSFTVSSSSGLLITSNSHGLVDTQVIRVTNTGGTLPTGLATGVDYYVKYVDANTFRLALTSGGTAIAYTNAGSPTHNWVTKTVNGLKHLKGQNVQVYYEGMQHVNLDVTSSGGSDETITLNHDQGDDVVVGLPYDAEMDTLTPSSPENQFSYSKRLSKIAVIVEESLGIQLEYNDLSEELLFRTTADAMGRQIPLFSGLRKLSLSGIGWDNTSVKIKSNGPLPMQLNAVIIETETGGS